MNPSHLSDRSVQGSNRQKQEDPAGQSHSDDAVIQAANCESLFNERQKKAEKQRQ